MNIITVFKTGGVFTSEYVKKLAEGVRRNLSADHTFYCLSDTAPQDPGTAAGGNRDPDYAAEWFAERDAMLRCDQKK